MRLIDADALKEEVNKKKIVGRFNTIMLIDNAPTVKTYCYFCGQTEHGQIEERPIHCKDCKYTVLSKDGKTLICCMTMKVGTVKPDFYCGNAEMKGDAE